MTVQVASPGMKRVNYRVDQLQYAADVDASGLTTAEWPACPAASATAILNAQSIATAGNGPPVASFNAANLGRYGRNLQVVASGAATSNVTITGTDWLGQGLKESFTLNGSTPVLGKKMFATVDNIAWGLTAGTTINVGFGNKLGLPYKAMGTAIIAEQTSDVQSGTAGVLTAGAATQTLTSEDPRGNFAPNGVPDGTKTYRLTYIADRNQLHGAAHVTA